MRTVFGGSSSGNSSSRRRQSDILLCVASKTMHSVVYQPGGGGGKGAQVSVKYIEKKYTPCCKKYEGHLLNALKSSVHMHLMKTCVMAKADMLFAACYCTAQ